MSAVPAYEDGIGTGESIGRRLQEIACDCRNARRTEAVAVDVHQFFALGTYLKGNDREVRELQPGFNGNRPGAETDIPEYTAAVQFQRL